MTSTVIVVLLEVITMWFAVENTMLYIGPRSLQKFYPWRSRVTRGDPWKAFLHALGRTWRLLESSAGMSMPVKLF